MKGGERGRPIETYGKKEQKEWLDNILTDTHPCSAVNKEQEYTETVIAICSRIKRGLHI